MLYLDLLRVQHVPHLGSFDSGEDRAAQVANKWATMKQSLGHSHLR
jgi:hypothetical protein